jgi:hypothetical protein
MTIVQRKDWRIDLTDSGIHIYLDDHNLSRAEFKQLTEDCNEALYFINNGGA